MARWAGQEHETYQRRQQDENLQREKLLALCTQVCVTGLIFRTFSIWERLLCDHRESACRIQGVVGS
jgi:hypothetical protein